VVVDDADASLTGAWVESASSTPFIGSGYRHDNNADKGSLSAAFVATFPQAGRYQVVFHYPANPNRATNVPVTVVHSGGQNNLTLNQQSVADTGFSLGTFDFGATGRVNVSNAGTDGYVIVDAVRFIRR
jgi:hypothetical protein